MRFSVAMNGDEALLEGLSRHPEVDGVYGISTSIVGGGRSAFGCMTVSRESVEKQVALAHKHNIKFNYLLNATCLNNTEYTKETYAEIVEILEWADRTGIDWITVAIPYLLQVAKERFPRLKVSVSSFANTESVQRAKQFNDLGADEITLRENVNRDFKLLEQLRKSVSCELQVIANHSCLYWCPFQTYHPNLMSHSSQMRNRSTKGVVDYCILSCSKAKITNPEEFIKSRWIRPEDLRHYEDIGIDKFKIVDRTKSTEWLLKVVGAYASRRWDGNLADLLNIQQVQSNIPMNRDLIEPLPENIQTIRALRTVGATLFSARVHIDNRALDGFIDFFKKKDCRASSCDECGYCRKLTGKAVTVEQEVFEAARLKHKEILGDLINGKLSL